MRMMHGIMLIATIGYAIAGEMVQRPPNGASLVFMKGFAVLAIVEIVLALVIRKKMLPKTIEVLRHNPGDRAAIGRWQTANIYSFVIAVSVGLYGYALRFTGGSREMAAPFFVAGVILMILWRPRLEEGISSADAMPPPLG
jgi:hypothetical protein